MIKHQIKVNHHSYTIIFNDKTQLYAMKLRKLYEQSYSDMDTFDEVSSETSETVSNLLKHAVSPEVKEDDMDGVIQQVLRLCDRALRKG